MKGLLLHQELVPLIDPNNFMPVEGKYQILYKVISGMPGVLLNMNMTVREEEPFKEGEYDISITFKNVKTGETTTFE